MSNLRVKQIFKKLSIYEKFSRKGKLAVVSITYDQLQ